MKIFRVCWCLLYLVKLHVYRSGSMSNCCLEEGGVCFVFKFVNRKSICLSYIVPQSRNHYSFTLMIIIFIMILLITIVITNACSIFFTNFLINFCVFCICCHCFIVCNLILSWTLHLRFCDRTTFKRSNGSQ